MVSSTRAYLTNISHCNGSRATLDFSAVMPPRSQSAAKALEVGKQQLPNSFASI